MPTSALTIIPRTTLLLAAAQNLISFAHVFVDLWLNHDARIVGGHTHPRRMHVTASVFELAHLTSATLVPNNLHHSR